MNIKDAWTLKHITQDKITKEFIAWDETGANEICKKSTKEDAIKACVAYAKTL